MICPIPCYTDTIELDISTVEPALAGPSRPQDRINLKDMKEQYHKSLTEKRGSDDQSSVNIEMNGETDTLGDGSVVIAAITSCTNTSNPSVMVAAGLVAKKGSRERT